MRFEGSTPPKTTIFHLKMMVKPISSESPLPTVHFQVNHVIFFWVVLIYIYIYRHDVFKSC